MSSFQARTVHPNKNGGVLVQMPHEKLDVAEVATPRRAGSPLVILRRMK